MPTKPYQRNQSTIPAVGASRSLALLSALLATFLICAGNARAAGLWIPNASNLGEFQGNFGSGTSAAHRLLINSDIQEGSGIAFDKHGNLWNTNFNTSTLTEFTKTSLKRLKKHPSPSAAVIISDSGSKDLNQPEGFAFDKSQDLWVGAEKGHGVIEYTPSQLGSTGNPAPNIILNGETFDFVSPSNVLFDKKGNLWVIDEDLGNHTAALAKSSGTTQAR